MAPGAAGDTTSILLADRGIYNTILADGPAGLRLIPHFVVDADGKMVSSGNPLEDAFNKNEIEVPEGGTGVFPVLHRNPGSSTPCTIVEHGSDPEMR